MKYFKAFLVGLFLFLIPIGLNYFSSNSFFYDLKEENLVKEIEDKIKSISQTATLDTLYLLNSFSSNEQQIINEFYFNKTTQDNLGMIKTFLILEERFPLSFSGKLIFERNKWSDNVLFAIILAAFGFFFTLYFETVNNKIFIGTTSLQNSKDELEKKVKKTLDDWKSIEVNQLSKEVTSALKNLSSEVDQDFKNVIKDYYNAHKGFMQGIYSNYPYDYSSMFNPNDTTFVDLQNGTRSLYILMDNYNSDKYSNFSISLLDFAKKSIKSTSYFDNEKFINLLEDDEGNMNNWLRQVNKKTIVTGFILKRVHIFNPNDPKREFQDFLNRLLENENAKNNYKTNYTDPIKDDFRIWQLTNTRLFYGEYIIFDNQVMIKYDEEFQILELFIGSIVKKFSESFDNPDNAHTIFDNKSRVKLFTDLA